jgi:hypothetical protein
MATASLPPQDNSYQVGEPPVAGALGQSSITLLAPESLTRPLWKSFLLNLRDRIVPPNLPPLQLTSTPVDVITPVGRMLGTPWYRTVFSNLGDVLSPESLPPLQLESRPIDVGELVSDKMSRPWWSSLLRSLGDSLSSETLPPLQLESTPVEVEELIGDRMSKAWWRTVLHSVSDAISRDEISDLQVTSAPLNPGISSVGLVLPLWSSLIPMPTTKASVSQIPVPPQQVREAIPMPAPARVQILEPPVRKMLPIPLAAIQVDADELYPLVHQFKDSLARSRRREIFWVSAISVEAIVLLCRYLGLF